MKTKLLIAITTLLATTAIVGTSLALNIDSNPAQNSSHETDLKITIPTSVDVTTTE